MFFTISNYINKNNLIDRSKNQIEIYSKCFKKIVRINCEKIAFVAGYGFMSLSQRMYGKDQLNLPPKIKEKLDKGSPKELDETLGMITSDQAETIKEPFLIMSDPIYMGFKTKTITNVEELGLPREILNEKFKDFLDFIVTAKLYRYTRYYGHQVYYDPVKDEIFLLVDSEYRGSAWVLSHFRLDNRSGREHLFLPPFIVDRSSKERYAYLQDGLVRHDSETDVRPYKILPRSERPSTPEIVFKFSLNGNFDSPKGVQELDFHCWCELVRKSGETYSFGLFAQGVVQSPDPFGFYKKNIKSVKFPISNLKISELLVEIQKGRFLGHEKFNIGSNNCSSFIRKIASSLNLHPSINTKLKDLYSFTTRIRIFAVATILSKLLKTKDVAHKIIAIEELAKLQKYMESFPDLIKELFDRFNIENASKSIALKNCLEDKPGMKESLIINFNILKMFGEIINAQELMSHVEAFPIKSTEVTELCDSITSVSERALAYKIYNLIDSFFQNYGSYEFSNPHRLYEELRKSEQER